MEKVTVIIPTYKRPTNLIRAINSVLYQTYENIEIIVVDDNGIGTKEQIETEKLLLSFISDNKIKYEKNKVNSGGSFSRNVGIKLATGQYVTFLDDDDFFFDDRIEIIVSKLKETDYGAAYTNSIIMENKKIRSIYKAKKICNEKNELLMTNVFYHTGSNMFFKKDAINKIGYFDEEFKRHQDIEYMIRYFDYYDSILPIDNTYVIKNNDDKINFPKIDTLIETKKIFLSKFSYELNNDNRENVLKKNYSDIYKFMYINKDFSRIDEIKENVGKISLVKKMKYKLFYLYHSTFISKLYLFLSNFLYKLKINKIIRSNIKKNNSY